MTMKWWSFKFVMVLTIVFSSLSLYGESIDSVKISKTKSEDKYDERIDRYVSRWSKIIPKYTKIQFAGSMGFLSFGTGWDYAKHWETDLFLGFVPRFSTDRAKVTFTIKQNYIPWKKDINEKFMFEPMTCGLYANTVLGGDFWTSEPDKYPKGYYNFSTRVRFNIFIGQRFTYKIRQDKRFFAKSITFFYEINTSDLYLVSAATNRYLKPKDYLGLSFGIKLQAL